jgi:predicted short-subunit dehydrogenase-like oxidoreductase (DUF2520 family)
LRRGGYDVAAVVDSSPETLRKNITYTGGKSYTDIGQLALSADCFLITTGDDQIEDACRRLDKHIHPSSVVLHMSGVGSLSMLDAAKRAGAKVGSIHPLQTFSDVEGAVRNLPGSFFGVTVDPSLTTWADGFVRSLGGIPFFVADEDRPLYHAAACVVSNYFVALLAMAEKMYGLLGLSEEEAKKAFWPLLTATMGNIDQKGVVSSLTGPIARGDLGTLKKHMESMETRIPELLPLYKSLGQMTAHVAERQGRLEEEKIAMIKSLLEKGSSS